MKGKNACGVSPARYGVINFQFAMNAAGNTLGAWQVANSVLADDSYATGYTWISTTAVQLIGAGAYAQKIAINDNGNAIVLWKQAEAAGRNTIWASVFK